MTPFLSPVPETAHGPSPFESLFPADVQTASARVMARMLDVVDYGIVLVQTGGRVAFVNQAARADLDHRHPLQLAGCALKVRDPQDAAALREALDSAQRKGLQRLLTLRDASGEAVTVAVLPVGGAGDDSAVLVFGKRKVCGELSTEAFARHHRLTAAESRVLRQLCDGCQAAEIAQTQGVALSTVRTQILSIREKTAASNIGALVRHVASLPPLQNRLRAAA
jgi:DNA-binding CsgD family transcriptional regulator